MIAIPVMTAYLSPGEYGLIAINTAIAALAIQCSNFGLINYSERVTFKFSEKKLFPPVFGMTVITGILISLISCIVISLYPSFWNVLFLNKIRPPVPWFYLIPIWFAFFQSISNYFYYYLIDTKNGKFYFFVNFIRALCTSLLPVGGLIFLKFTILEVILSYFFIEVIFAIYSLARLKRIIRIDFRYIRFLKLGFKFGWPYFPFGFTGWIVQQVDKLFLGFYQGASVLGMYFIAVSFSGIYSMLSQSINYAFSPVMMMHLDRDKSSEGAKKRMGDAVKIYLFGLQFFGLVVALFSREIIYIFTNVRFHEAFHVVPLLLTALVVRDMDVIINSYHLMNRNKTFFYNVVFSLQAAVVLVINYLLVPQYGGYGSATALLTSNLMIYTINRNYVSSVLGKQYSQYSIFAGFFLFGIDYILLAELTASVSMGTAILMKLLNVLIVFTLLVAYYRKFPVFDEIKARFLKVPKFKTSY